MDRLEGVESTEDRRSDEDIIWARLIQIIKSRELWVYKYMGRATSMLVTDVGDEMIW